MGTLTFHGHSCFEIATGDKIKLRDAAGKATKARRTGTSFRVYSGENVALVAKHRGKSKYKLHSHNYPVLQLLVWQVCCPELGKLSS